MNTRKSAERKRGRGRGETGSLASYGPSAYPSVPPLLSGVYENACVRGEYTRRHVHQKYSVCDKGNWGEWRNSVTEYGK
jgi:hypothetical protein